MRKVLSGIVAAGWLAWSPAAGATKVVALMGLPWVIESADYTGAVHDRIAQVEGVYAIRLIQDGWAEIPLALGATVTGIEIVKKAGEAHVVPRSGSYSLMASRKGLYKVRVEFSTLLVQESQLEGLGFSIPQATFSTLTLAVPRKDIELRPDAQLYTQRKPDGAHDGVTLTARLGAASRVELRWMTRPATPERIEPVIYGETFSLAVLEEQLARLTTMVEYRVTQGEVKELTLELPKALQIVNVRGGGIDSWKVMEEPERNRLRIALNFALKDGGYQLVLEGEQPFKADEKTFQLPEMALVGVKQERGQWAVATAGSLEVAAQTVEGASRIDAKEVSDILRRSTALPILLAFRYHQHPYRALLSLTHYDDLPVLNAIAEQGELVTVVSRQGERLTRAIYAVRANKKQFLGATLPEGAMLWSCTVDRRSVKPVDGTGGQLLIPLTSAKAADEPMLVELVYFERQAALTGMGHLTLRGPVLDIPTTVANWLLYTPRQTKLLKTSGNLERGAGPMQVVEEPFQVALPSAVPSRIAGGFFNARRLSRQAEAPKSVATSAEEGERGGQLAQYEPYYAEQNLTAGRSDGYTESYGLSKFVKPSAVSPVTRAGTEGEGDDVRSAAVGRMYLGSVAGALGSALFGEGGDKNKRGGPSEPPRDNEADEKQLAAFDGAVAMRMQEAGILPLKIHLPKAGRLYRFNRLLTSQEALHLDASFVTLPDAVGPWPLFGVGLLALSGGGIALKRRR
ncbi:MAG: hypothetical protein HYZ92_01295 [Candidatus Omnitrophica bacterium]|nr:hypothetical protein [Candidatus Omnitrophota bacterium]